MLTKDKLILRCKRISMKSRQLQNRKISDNKASQAEEISKTQQEEKEPKVLDRLKEQITKLKEIQQQTEENNNRLSEI
jgi:hypothetical protein